MKTRKLSLIVNSLVFLALVVTSLASPANAQPTLTFTVTANTDVVDATPGDGVCETETGNGMCTLRAAIMEANAHVGADTIILPAAEYNLTLPGADEDLSASGDLDITDSLTITGAGYGDTIIDANAVDERVLTVFLTNDPVTISGVKIQSGNAQTSPGGGIANYSDLSLDHVIFYYNHTEMYGGGIWNQNSLTLSNVSFFGNSAIMEGGGAYSQGPFLADQVYFGYNSSEENGGGLFATYYANVTLVSAEFYNNTTPNNGGNIYIVGGLTMEDSSVINGDAGNIGGGIYIAEDATATITNTILRNNHAVSGGGINVTIHGTLVANNLLLDMNAADQVGGAINNYEGTAYLSRSVLSNNSADQGGAIHSLNILFDGKLVIEESSVISNTATTYGGGVFCAGDTTLSGVTVSNNHAEYGGGLINSWKLAIVNSTISKNSAKENGGGLYDSTTITPPVIYNSTITGNLAGADMTHPGGLGGGVYAYEGSNIQFRNTILSGNHHRQLLNFVDDDCYGKLESGDYNLVGTLNNCTLVGLIQHVQIGEDPLLGELADNGGPTQTHALLEGSPAIDGGNPEGCLGIEDALLTSDQRGENRPLDGNGNGTAVCDIGAYELTHQVTMYLPLLVK
jgi:predicted outer membrane repeat protein